MVKDHPFVQKVEHIKNHILSIILYGAEQMVDFQHILKTVESPRVGIDKTFNLGSFYVTAFVYKNHIWHLHAINSHGKPYRRLLCAEVLVLETLSGH
jgi:hypothetical protein